MNMPSIRLYPQECGGKYTFSSPLFMTQGFQTAFNDSAAAIATFALIKVQKERVGTPEGADYLQVLETNGTRFWLIDDLTHITALLPEDY